MQSLNSRQNQSVLYVPSLMLEFVRAMAVVRSIFFCLFLDFFSGCRQDTSNGGLVPKNADSLASCAVSFSRGKKVAKAVYHLSANAVESWDLQQGENGSSKSGLLQSSFQNLVFFSHELILRLIGFFQHWWQQQNEKKGKKNSVLSLVGPRV